VSALQIAALAPSTHSQLKPLYEKIAMREFALRLTNPLMARSPVLAPTTSPDTPASSDFAENYSIYDMSDSRSAMNVTKRGCPLPRAPES